MIKLKIKNIDNYIYTVCDINNKEYKLMLELHDIDFKLDVGDIIYLDEYYLKESALYSFGSLNGKYGRDITSENDIDLMIIKKDDKEIYLKRFYG